MITELAVERVEFACVRCRDRWTVDYDVQRFMDGLGHEWEYFSRDNRSVPSPYAVESAPRCDRCGRRRAGRLAARRPVPLPGMPGSPRSPVPDTGGHRPERHSAPVLSATDHRQPAPTALPAPTAAPTTAEAPAPDSQVAGDPHGATP